MPTTYALIPGAGGSAWYWHRVTPLLTADGTEAIAIDLPADDDSADLTTYADTVYTALAGVPGPVVARRPVHGRLHRTDGRRPCSGRADGVGEPDGAHTR